ESTLDHRVLRATKNRFGSVDEIGVFRMTETGLDPVQNPSELFLGDRLNHASGSAITALLEGTRPVLIEVQALAAKAGFGTPQRVATGYDGRRLALLLAVLDKRAGLSFAQLDVFLNVVGGVRLQEPAGDLAVAAALASSIYGRALPNDGGELKQFRWVAGKPMLLHSLQAFMARADVVSVVCVLPQSHAADPPPWIFQCDVDRLMISLGGRTRQESVANGIDDLPDEA